MNQNIPPGQPGQQDGNERTNPYADVGPEPDRSDVGSNPYYAQHQSAPPPDLDAAAPTLKSSDIQRLNRKALVFLVGIVALLVLAVVLMLRNATSGKNEQDNPVREETVVIPELPRTSPVAEQSVQPIAMAPETLPPLPQEAQMQAGYPPSGVDDGPREPSLLERRIAASAGPSELSNQNDPYVQAMLAGLPGAQQNSSENVVEESVTSARYIQRPNALLVRGTYIRCILETRIITDIPGYTSCIVTEPVYSINGRKLLLPKGSKILGSYNSGLGGVPRVSVIWDRITTPNGIDVAMSSPGVDNLGGAGYPGHYDAHWGSKISSALLISMISDAFKYAAAEHGPETTTITGSGLAVQSPYESATARTMERLANQALDRNMSRPPTVTINQGTLVNVYVAKDVDFSAVVAQY